MNGRMAFPAQRLQIAQRIVAGASGAASSGAAAIQMMNGEIVVGSTTLTGELISFQRLLPVSAKAVVVPRLAEIAVESLFGHALHGATYGFCSFDRGAFRAAGLWPAVINIIVSTIGARVDRSDNTRTSFAATFDEVVAVVSGADEWRTWSAGLLASTGGLIGSAAFLADALAIAVAGLAMGLKRTTFASLRVRRVPDHSFATAWANDGSVSSRRHAPMLRQEVETCPAS